MFILVFLFMCVAFLQCLVDSYLPNHMYEKSNKICLGMLCLWEVWKGREVALPYTRKKNVFSSFSSLKMKVFWFYAWRIDACQQTQLHCLVPLLSVVSGVLKSWSFHYKANLLLTSYVFLRLYSIRRCPQPCLINYHPSSCSPSSGNLLELLTYW